MLRKCRWRETAQYGFTGREPDEHRGKGEPQVVLHRFSVVDDDRAVNPGDHCDRGKDRHDRDVAWSDVAWSDVAWSDAAWADNTAADAAGKRVDLAPGEQARAASALLP